MFYKFRCARVQFASREAAVAAFNSKHGALVHGVPIIVNFCLRKGSRGGKSDVGFYHFYYTTLSLIILFISDNMQVLKSKAPKRKASRMDASNEPVDMKKRMSEKKQM